MPDHDALALLIEELRSPLPPVRFPLVIDDGRVWQDDGDGLDDEGIDFLNRLASALSPAQAAEQDRLAAIGAAVERLIAAAGGEGWDLSDARTGVVSAVLWSHGGPGTRAVGHGQTVETAIRAALDEPVTGEPERWSSTGI